MHYLLILTFLLAPAYTVKFNIGPMPANLLMVWVIFVWAAFVINLFAKKDIKKIFGAVKNTNRKILVFTSLFFLSGVVGLFWNGFNTSKLGQFVVLFLQPVSIFFIAGFEWQKSPNSKRLLLAAGYLLLAALGIYSIIQYFTLWGLSPAYWGNSLEPKRATAFFAHPNFYSLFAAPLLAFLMPDAFRAILKFKIENSKLYKPIFWALGAIGLILSLSRAGWMGLGIAGLVYFVFVADKKIRKASLAVFIALMVIVLAVPNLRWRFIMPFYGEKSASSRVDLWKSGVKAIKSSPVFGLGLKGYSDNYRKFQSNTALDSHNFPHNIFLNFWVETGLMGLIGLIGLIGLFIYRGLIDRGDLFKLGTSLFLIALIFQGLIDNPYLKNDLAMVFWLVLSFSYGNSQQKIE